MHVRVDERTSAPTRRLDADELAEIENVPEPLFRLPAPSSKVGEQHRVCRQLREIVRVHGSHFILRTLEVAGFVAAPALEDEHGVAGLAQSACRNRTPE